MVRNESKILERCLKSVESLVDAFCIHDTGSTDNTCEIAEEFLKTHKGCLTKSVWQNFGVNRTASFVEAQKFIGPDSDTYGLLIDADMVFQPGELRNKVLTETGYTVVQKSGNLAYPNTRLVRMDYRWTCKGVTHEYWDGPTSTLPESVCWIEDHNDGGCKSDKFDRDARLLEEGLIAEPDNVRYLFYLAQTYHSLGRWKDAIGMYKRRFNAGGWDEERWYSLYMMGQSWLSLENPIQFEKYMLKAHAFRPNRAENLYKLAKYFREKGDHYKCYHYAKLGRALPLSKDALFVETNVYNGLFEYEMTVSLYYLGKLREGLRESMAYLLKRTENLDNVYGNISFYIEPLKGGVSHHPVMRDVCGRDMHPSSVSSCDGVDNVRFVNYSIDDKGGYDMKKGKYSPDHHVVTQNVLWAPGSPPRIMKDSSVDLPRVPTHILGLEDIRIYRDSKNTMRFVSASREYHKNDILIVAGEYRTSTHTYENTRLIKSPLGSTCEKNWIPVNGTEDIIYSWKPLRVGNLKEDELVFHTSHDTPWFFQHLRGSAVPTRVGDKLWCLVHFVEYNMPRKYFHCIVSMDVKTYKPDAICMPFSFRETGIEYCLSMTVSPFGDIRFIVSSWDDNPCIMTVPTSTFEWIQV
jgi:glycosyltransferase involved in cell wall biosynthesis